MIDSDTDFAQQARNWSFPTAIRFGAGRIGELPEVCVELGLQRPLLVTDPGLAALPMIGAAVDALNAHKKCAGCAVFADIQGNPVEANVIAGVKAYRAGAHDGIVAFGGGSALDAAKAVALMVGQQRPIWDFEDREDWYTRANAEGIAPVVAVPTTSGTGSEVGRAAVITDERDHTKKIIFHPALMPAVVIADPELTVGLPSPVTAAVGMDALSHNLEAYLSPVFHPLAHGIAIEGMRLIERWLPTAVADGKNLNARAAMQVAASMGATAFQKGLGAMHSLSHPCSALFGTHHGLTNAVVMPYVLKFNRPAVEAKLDDLARCLNLNGSGYDAVLRWVLDLREQLCIPHTLAEIGVEAGELPRMAGMAEIDPSSATNPVPVTSDNLLGLYRAAHAGEL